MSIIKLRKFSYAFSGILFLASIALLAVWGLRLGIDFTGGSLMEIQFQNQPSRETIQSALRPFNLGDVHVQPTQSNGALIRMKDVDEPTHQKVLSALKVLDQNLVEKRFDSIGPVLGNEALRKALFSLVLVLIAIILFIAYAFRKVSQPISSWKYGIVAIIALLHDVIIPVGVFAVLGHFLGYEIDTLFITALLVVLGFSVHDTIVVFDRVRENLGHASGKKPFDQIVGESISQTFTRSINTSLTTLLALVVLYFVGGESTQHFSLALIVGIIAGTYSSVFIGSPLLVTIWKWQEGRKGK